jgi:hypothetical protein
VVGVVSAVCRPQDDIRDGLVCAWMLACERGCALSQHAPKHAGSDRTARLSVEGGTHTACCALWRLVSGCGGCWVAHDAAAQCGVATADSGTRRGWPQQWPASLPVAVTVMQGSM